MPAKQFAFGEPLPKRSTVPVERSASDGHPGNDQPDRRQREHNNQNLREHIECFVSDDMGYLKVRRGLDSEDVHLTWQFCNGKFYGHYVYVRVSYWQLDYGLELLIQKRDEVYTGSRTPTPDKRKPSHD
jgi:hypothetical protein